MGTHHQGHRGPELAQPNLLFHLQCTGLDPGDYWVDEAEGFLDPNLVNAYGIDFDQSGIRGRGVARWTEDGELFLDLNTEVRVVLTMFNFSESANISWRGFVSEYSATDESDPLGGSFDVNLTCGSLDEEQLWIKSDVPSPDEPRGGWIEMPYRLGPINLMIRIHLTELEAE